MSCGASGTQSSEASTSKIISINAGEITPPPIVVDHRSAIEAPVVARCISGGLVSDQGLAVDASLIEADANRQNSTKIGVTVEEYETRLVSWPARETGELWGIGDRPQQGPNCHSPNGSKRP